MTGPRLRFAPSPTGYLHIGGVRTALFNWLWARHTKGTFVLRIEDTDQERSTPESRQVILDSLDWLGLDWDEGPRVGGPHGPYTQMERLALYKEMSERLIASGKAYRCYCTKAELDAQREAVKKKDPKATFRYPGTCRDRKDEPDLPFVVRFRMPEGGGVTYVDKVFGEVTTPNAAQQDFVLIRAGGVPLYNFGAVVDDVTMGITLVARGRDHMVNTPPQILLYEAFGATVPEFAHLPMMLSASGEKLSKRHGAVSVGEYKNDGYAPGAVLNYLVRFGWSSGDQEVFSLDELIAKFDWAHCGKGDGKFDPKKFLAIEHEHLRSPRLVPDDEYVTRVLPFVAARGIESPNEATLRAALPAIRDRAHTFVEAADLLDFFLREPPVMDEKAAEKAFGPGVAKLLRGLITALEGAPTWGEATLEEEIKAWAAKEGIAFKEIAQPARVALTGRTASPSLHQVMVVLGKEVSPRAPRSRGGAGGSACVIPDRALSPSARGVRLGARGPAGPRAPARHLAGARPDSGLLLILPLVYLFFRSTWRELDEEAYRYRGEILAKGEQDVRPLVAMAMAAVILTMHEYYGGRAYFDEAIRPALAAFDAKHHDKLLHFAHYDELYSFGWWAFTRVVGYTIIPFGVWKIAFPRDSLLDLGLRTHGFLWHAWIYVLFLAFVLPAMWVVSRQPDFGSYYPFYKNASRSWFDFLAWEAMYFAQFFALEMFFRGFWLGVLRRSFGSGAIFAMAVPYCMIHFQKPYLEVNGAIIAGIALGSLSMKTKSIYQGFLVHITVAGLMDWLSLAHRHALPKVLWPPG